jgi:hypothetical protein
MMVVVETMTPYPGPESAGLLVVEVSGDKSNINAARALGASAAQHKIVETQISFRIEFTLLLQA